MTHSDPFAGVPYSDVEPEHDDPAPDHQQETPVTAPAAPAPTDAWEKPVPMLGSGGSAAARKDAAKDAGAPKSKPEKTDPLALATHETMDVPGSAQIERGVVASILSADLDAAPALELVRGMGVRADDFETRMRTIFEAACAVHEQQQRFDVTDVIRRLREDGDLDRVGGPMELIDLQGESYAFRAEKFADDLLKASALRRMLVGTVRANQILRGTGDFSDKMAAAAKAIEDAEANEGPEETLYESAAMQKALDLSEALSKDEVPAGIAPPYRDLADDLGMSFRGGQFVIFAARPSIGKTTALLDAARHAVTVQGKSGLFVSLEMSEEEIGAKLIAAQGRVPLANLLSGKEMQDIDWDRASQALLALSDDRLVIDVRYTVTVSEIRLRALRLKRQGRLDFLIIDYIQLLTHEDKRLERRLAVEDMSRRLKLLAKELDVPVITAAQLNRNAEGRGDKKPMLGDLREAGGLEQDADAVVLLHREDFYDKESVRAGECDLIVAKHRSGKTGTATVVSQLHYSRFQDIPND